jgi:N-acetylmuramoyl-L-alanine amidase
MWQLKILVYLFQVSVCSLAFFALYALLIRNLTFFTINRIYLIFALICSFAIPLARINLQSDIILFPKNSEVYDQFDKVTTISAYPITINSQSSLSAADLLIYVYILGTVVVLLKSLKSLIELLNDTKRESVNVNGLNVIYKNNGFVNCSFFNYVFIDPLNFSGDEIEMIMLHENVHATQWHSADKMFVLVCKIILWFNPLIYFYDKELERAHEFEADSAVLNIVDTKAYAQLLIRLASKKTTNLLVHDFGKHPVKERIFVFFKDRSKAPFMSVYALVIPLFMGLTSLFSINFVSAYPFSRSPFTLIIDPGHGGSDNGAVYGDINEKQLALALVQKMRVIADSKGLKISVTRDNDSYVTLKQRGGMHGDVLLSIHHNASPDKNKNGIQILSGSSSSSSRRAIIKDLTFNLYQNFKSLKDINAENVSKEVIGSYILERSTAPSIMLELGYLTNEHDRDFLTDSVHQNELANAIINSVLAYKDHITSN